MRFFSLLGFSQSKNVVFQACFFLKKRNIYFQKIPHTITETTFNYTLYIVSRLHLQFSYLTTFAALRGISSFG
ncbi:MAG: hypothetical protein K0Q95_411 [Bacteroidota bacterium]|nr:hypothetical protein [Bacteroidota bacterium]